MTSLPEYQRVLVTGAAGFIGRHLLAHILDAEYPPDILALDKQAGPKLASVRWACCDLTNSSQVRETITEFAPEAVIHLAGITNGDNLDALFAVNVQACHSLLTACADLPRKPRVLVVGSAAEYGIVSCESPVISEDHPLLAASPYGVSKMMQERWAMQFSARMPVVAVRPFNIMGPGQSPHLVPSAFLTQIIDVIEGRSECVNVGNISTERDFIDVRDVASALWALICADDGVDGHVFNIASGQPLRIEDILNACLELAPCEIPVRQAAARLKQHDVPVIIGNPQKLKDATGWQPAVPWRQSVLETMNSLGRTIDHIR